MPMQPYDEENLNTYEILTHYRKYRSELITMARTVYAIEKGKLRPNLPTDTDCEKDYQTVLLAAPVYHAMFGDWFYDAPKTQEKWRNYLAGCLARYILEKEWGNITGHPVKKPGFIGRIKAAWKAMRD